VRNLLSVCIWLRWPTALLALVVWGAILASYRWSVWFGHSIGQDATYLFGTLGQGRLGISSVDASVPLAPTWKIEPASGFGDKYLAFSHENGAGVLAVAFDAGTSKPLWPVGCALAIPATMGFIVKRRRDVVDSCRRCRCVLDGAAVCPECGTRVRK